MIRSTASLTSFRAAKEGGLLLDGWEALGAEGLQCVFFRRCIGAPTVAGTEGGDTGGRNTESVLALAHALCGLMISMRGPVVESVRSEWAYRTRRDWSGIGTCPAELGFPVRHCDDGHQNHNYGDEHRGRGSTHSSCCAGCTIPARKGSGTTF